MPPKKKKDEPKDEPVAEEEPVPEEPPPPTEDEVTELPTGLQLPLRGKDVEHLWSLQNNYEQQVELLVKLLGLNEKYPKPAQRDIVCDFHIFNLSHAKSICLNTKQGAVFHAIMQQILVSMHNQSVTPNTKPNDMNTVDQCFAQFQRLILQHSVLDPPNNCLDVFRASEAKLIAEFASMTLFKHFLLYQYCVNFDRDVETLHASMSLERPVPPPDLKDAQLKPKKSLEAQKADYGADGADPSEDKELTEEEEIERLVQEKLRDTEAKLQEKLKQREEALKQRLEEHKAHADPHGKKGKK